MDWADWWTIGIDAGWGAALGVLFAGIVGGRRGSLALTAGLAAAAGVALGFLVWNWDEAVGGLAGGLLGAYAAERIVGGALRRGGTRVGMAVLVALAAAALAALALAPVVGYVEALLLPLLAQRMRRRTPERYAGLRTLARD